MNKLLTILFLLIFTVSFSQENDSIKKKDTIKKDLKVGLVLSGGGAKGFAHVGVLKVLEETGVRVDYIGGTSMGAIVGAMYASGYNAKEIDSLIRTFDFDKIMQDQIPRKSKPFYEKQNGEKYAITLPVERGKVGLPKALSKGQNVLNLTSELLQHVDTIRDFNKLPIPFFCIATNLETGKQELLNSGFLPRAVQASGAFPTLLEPIEIDGKLLADGGIVNNFPIDEVLEMGADIIIGIDLKNDFDTKDELNSALKILNQIIGFQMYKDYGDKIKKTDVYLHPNIDQYEVTSFDKLEEIVKVGEDAARLKFDELVKIAAQQIGKREPILRKENPQEIKIKSIEIKGNKDYTRTYIKEKMKIANGEAITFSDFVEGINNLSATGNFTSVQYEIEEEKDGSIIRLKLKQNDISTYVNFSVHYDNLYKTGVLGNITSKHVLNKNDVFSLDLILGDNLRYNLDYFIDNGSNWSFGLKSRFNTFDFDTSLHTNGFNVSQLNLKYIDFTNQLYFQTVLNRKFALGIGAEHKRISASTKTLITTTNQEKTYFDRSDYFNAISYLKFDTYDKKYFQKEGTFVDIDFRWYLFSSDYNDNFNSFSQLKGKFGYAHTFFNKLTAHITSEAGITIGDNNNFILDYHLGGYGENYINSFIPFQGYEFAGLSNSTFLKSALTLRYEFIKKHYLMTTLNVARADSNLFNGGDIFENTKTGYGIGYGFDSFLGPVELNYTHSPDTKESFWYFNLGYWF
ncbi:MAG: patatin-like phospholipase family protein [Flavobacteriaceae bacterium]|nr:patatin-like phospholipase family protein [Flavobacteriaceae bacterium]